VLGRSTAAFPDERDDEVLAAFALGATAWTRLPDEMCRRLGRLVVNRPGLAIDHFQSELAKIILDFLGTQRDPQKLYHLRMAQRDLPWLGRLRISIDVAFGQLTAVVPGGATTGPISITTTDGSYTNSSTFYLPASITSFTPTNSAPGTTVTITGQNLLGTTNVSFNGLSTTFTPPVNNTTLQATVPANVTTGPISVTTPAGTTNSSGLFYAVPIITGFSPTHGLPGTNVTITGLNLLGATAVKFNGLSASFVPPTNNASIQAVVPANAQTGPITVITPAGTAISTNSFVLDYISDVAVSLTATPDPVFIGSNLVYTIVITNNGPLAAPNVSLTNTLPSSVILKSASASQGTLTTNGNPIFGSFPTVATGGSVTVILTVTPQSTGTITNKASLGSGYSDPAPANNNASITTTVIPLPILSVGLLSANVVRLSWPVQLTNFVLEYKPSLPPATMWSSVMTTPSISGNERVVLETNLVAARFYRLRL